MIIENSDGTYTVSFPELAPITITPPTDTELLLYGTSGTSGTWLSVLEKAYAQYKSNNAIMPSKNIYDDVNGETGYSEILLTGKSVDDDSFDFTLNTTTRTKLKKAMDTGFVVTVGMAPMQIKDVRGLRTKHSYGVIAYDSVSDKITLYDPTGNSDFTDRNGKKIAEDGIITLSLEECCQLFDFIYYESLE